MALAHPKATGMSDERVADHVGVSPKTVAKYRAEMETTLEIPESAKRIDSNGRTIDTSKIGRRKAAQAETAGSKQTDASPSDEGSQATAESSLLPSVPSPSNEGKGSAEPDEKPQEPSVSEIEKCFASAIASLDKTKFWIGEIHDLFPKTSRQHNAAIKTANKLQLLLEKWKTEASANTLLQQSDADISVPESHS